MPSTVIFTLSPTASMTTVWFFGTPWGEFRFGFVQFPNAQLWIVGEAPSPEKAKRKNQSSRFCFYMAKSSPNFHFRSIFF
jgi:hypothetical protein